MKAVECVYHRVCFGLVQPSRNVGPPPSLAEQLKQVLAERERRSSIESDSAGGHDSHSEDTNRSTIASSSLKVVRSALAIVANPCSPIVGALSSHFIWQPAVQNSTHSSMSSGSLSPGHCGNDTNALGSNFGSSGEYLEKI